MYRESNLFAIDETRCVRCGLCVKECPRGAIASGKEGLPESAEAGSEKCMHCLHCVMVCPRGAVSVDGTDPSKCPPEGAKPDFTSMLNLVRERRSIRRYKQENVPPGKIDALMDAMRCVPAGVNFHALHFSVIDNILTMNDFRNAMYSRITSLFETEEGRIKFARFKDMADAIKSGGDPVFRTAPHAVMVSCSSSAPCVTADPVIALSYFELLAKSQGTGTCWCGWLYLALKYLVPEMIERLNIPQGYELSYAMLFGIPDVQFLRYAPLPPVSRYNIK